MTAPPILEVRDLTATFPGDVRAVRGVSFTIQPGEILALVGESGAGKTVTAHSVLSLHPRRTVVGGSVRYKGEELLGQRSKALNRIRGNRIGMVFQDPMTSLNPVQRVGAQVAEVIQVHKGVGRKEARVRAVEMLERVGLPAPEEMARSFPHELSGGMRQRVMIAIAIANDPDLLIADEPTTALDVTVQAQILETIRVIQAETGVAVLLITHDFGLVANLADRVEVMYAGRIVESGVATDVFARPSMPYTVGLLGAVPVLHGRAGEALVPIGGSSPDPTAFPTGCAFHPRCPYAREVCEGTDPELRPTPDPDHRAACHFLEEVRERS